ncbi:MAG: response regulator [bacterium]
MRKLSVLLATEDHSLEERVLEILNENSYQVVVVDCCKEAIKNLLDNDFDLVIFDLSIKELDGLDTIQIIKSCRPQTHIISVLNNSSYETEKQIAKVGVYFRMEKPIDEQITKKLVQNLEKKIKSKTN